MWCEVRQQVILKIAIFHKLNIGFECSLQDSVVPSQKELHAKELQAGGIGPTLEYTLLFFHCSKNT